MEPLLESALETGPAQISPAFLRNPSAWLLNKGLSRQFWVFFTAAFFFDFGFAVYFFLFNLYLLDLHCNERTMGLIGGAFTLGTVVGTLPAGALARKVGLRPTLLLCFIAAPVMGALRTATVREPAQMALAFLAGIAMCIWGVCFLPAIAQLTTEQNRASAFGLIFSASIGTSALGGLLCGYVPGWLQAAGVHLQPAQVKCLILLAACALAAAGIVPLLRLRLPRTARLLHSSPSPRNRWRLPPFLLRFLPAMAIWAAVLVSFAPFANVYLASQVRIPLSQIGLIFSAAQILQFLAGLLTPLLFRRFGLLHGILATQVATAAALASLAATRNPTLAVVLYLSLTTTQWMSSPGLYNLLMSNLPESERSSAAAMTLFCNALLQSAATALAGILFVRFGYPLVLAGIALFALAAAALFRLLVGPAIHPKSAVSTPS